MKLGTKLIEYNLIVILLIIYYFYILFNYSVNFPRGDDIEQTFNYIHRITNYSISNQFFSLFTPMNTGHIIATHKLITLIDYYIFGSINVKRLIFYGNAFYVITLFTIISITSLNKKTAIFIFLICLVPFNHLINWAGTSIHHGSGILFCTLAFLFYAKNYNILLQILCCTISCFSLSNGILTFPLLILLHLSDHNYIKSVIILMSLIFITYIIVKLTPESILLLNPSNSFKFSLIFISGSFKNIISDYNFLLYVIGSLMIISPLLFRVMFIKKNKVLYSLYFFFIFTSLLISLKRPYILANVNRYSWYHSLCLAIYFIIVYNKINSIKELNIKRSNLLPTIFFTLIYSFHAITNQTKIARFHSEMNSSVKGFLSNDPSSSAYPEIRGNKRYINTIKNSVLSENYIIPHNSKLTNLPSATKTVNHGLKTYKIDYFHNAVNMNYYNLEIDISSITDNLRKNEYIYLVINDKTYELKKNYRTIINPNNTYFDNEKTNMRRINISTIINLKEDFESLNPEVVIHKIYKNITVNHKLKIEEPKMIK